MKVQKIVSQEIPKEQVLILKEGLDLLEYISKLISPDGDKSNYKIFDIRVLKALLSSGTIDVKLTIDQYESFTATNGVDFPEYYDSREEVNIDDKFPNGFDSWQETHSEIVSMWCHVEATNEVINKILSTHGHGAKYTLCKDWTSEFEKTHQEEWDGEFFDTLEEFFNSKLLSIKIEEIPLMKL